MLDEMNPAEYLTKTNTTFLVGDVLEVFDRVQYTCLSSCWILLY